MIADADPVDGTRGARSRRSENATRSKATRGREGGGTKNRRQNSVTVMATARTVIRFRVFLTTRVPRLLYPP